MGYYTDYTLKIESITGPITDEEQIANIREDVLSALNEHTTYEFEEIDGFEFTLQAAKWYSHDEDMLIISKLFPEYIFHLSGVGEEAGDMWINYFFNGKCQKADAKITYEPFDFMKLK